MASFFLLSCVVISLVGFGEVVNAKEGHSPSIGCPEGFKMEGSFCLKQMTMPPKVVCQFGVLEGTECVNYYSADKECPPDYDLRGDKCVKIDEMLPQAMCPLDYVLDGLTCKGSRFIEPMCPLGTVELEGSRCAMYSPSIKRCPAGFVATGNYHKGRGGSKCVKKVSISPTESCTKGYSLVSGTCMLVQSIPPVCPYGSTDVGDNKCAVYRAPAKSCQSGFNLLKNHSNNNDSSSKCMKSLSEEATPKCPANYLLSEDKKKCVKTTTISPVCPAGREELPDGRCVTYTPATAKCVDGFSLSYDSAGSVMCSKDIRQAASVNCSDGYDLSDSSCVKRIQSPMVCPAGSRADGDKCFSESSALYKCEQPFQLQSSHGENKCVRVDVQLGIAGCTKDFMLSDKAGYCEKKKMCDPVFLCKEGAREDGRCVDYMRASPVYICPQGFESSSLTGPSRCVQKVTKDCSRVEYQTKCREAPECFNKKCEHGHEEHQEQEQQTQARSLRHFGKFRNPGIVGGHFSSSKKQICEKVAVTIPKKCEKMLFADAVKSCPVGSKAQGKGCISPQYHNLDVKCPEGVYDETLNQCVKIYKKPAVYSCPEGYSKSIVGGASKCMKPVFSGVVYYCSNSSTDILVDRMCRKSVEKVCEGGVCERKVAMLADVQCPDGYHLANGSQEGEEAGSFGVCVKTNNLSVMYVCADGSQLVDLNKCATYFPKECAGGSCEVKSHAAVEFECKSGFELQEPVQTHSHRNFSSGVHHHHHRENNQVMDTTTDHYHGTTPKCVSTVFDTPEQFCSDSESILKEGKCVTYSDKKCPNDKCESVSEKPVSYTCPDGYSRERDFDVHTQMAASPMVQQYGARVKKEKRIKRMSSAMQIKCVATEEAMFEHFCSKGEMSENNQCAKYFVKACPHNRCAMEMTMAPKYKCEEGFSLDGKKKNAFYHQRRRDDHVPLCKVARFHDPMFRCHKGESDATGRKCRKTSPPKYLCPKGASRSGGSCLMKEYLKPGNVYV